MGAGEEDSQVARPLLHIPSHSQVLENSRPQPPPSFFRPSSSSSVIAQSSSQAVSGIQSGGGGAGSQQEHQQGRAPSSFTEAFSFVRQTEFYTPPPPAPAPAAPAPSSGGDPGSGVGSKPQEYVFLRIFFS